MKLNSLIFAVAGFCLSAGASYAQSPKDQDVALWQTESSGAVTFLPSNGTCPSTLLNFTRTENSHIDMPTETGPPRQDGVCQYSNADGSAYITAYFYITEGRTRHDEVLNAASSVMQVHPVEVMQEETQDCSDVIQFRAILSDFHAMAELTESGEREIVIDQSELYCVVMKFTNRPGRTWAVVNSDGEYFTKIRATIGAAPTDEMDSQMMSAISEFYSQQGIAARLAADPPR